MKLDKVNATVVVAIHDRVAVVGLDVDLKLCKASFNFKFPAGMHPARSPSCLTSRLLSPWPKNPLDSS